MIEIFLSEAPCAMARIFMLLAPRLLKSFPLIPWCSFILSPTTAIFTRSVSKRAGYTLFKDISKAKCSSITSLAFCASSALTPKQIEYSEEAWVIMIIFMFSLDRVSKSRLEKPGIPTIPLPSRLIRATSSIWLIPLTI